MAGSAVVRRARGVCTIFNSVDAVVFCRIVDLDRLEGAIIASGGLGYLG